MRILIISADRFEDTELLVPYYRFQEEGMSVDVASLKPGSIKGKHGYEVQVNLGIDDLNPEHYDALVLPGGEAPAALRGSPRVHEVVRAFFYTHKPVAAICHGPQILISAGVLRGRSATCYKSVAAELKEAGVRYRDAEAVVDENLITSRQPTDLPAFMRAIMEQLHARQRQAQAA